MPRVVAGMAEGPQQRPWMGIKDEGMDEIQGRLASFMDDVQG
jgi:hypothetical protein